MAITLGYPAFSTPVDLRHVETSLFYIRGRALPRVSAMLNNGVDSRRHLCYRLTAEGELPRV